MKYFAVVVALVATLSFSVAAKAEPENKELNSVITNALESFKGKDSDVVTAFVAGLIVSAVVLLSINEVRN